MIVPHACKWKGEIKSYCQYRLYYALYRSQDAGQEFLKFDINP
jgi:hypothetical protein